MISTQRIIFCLYYFAISIAFIVGSFWLLFSAQTLLTFLFSICLLLLLFTPVIFILKGKVNKYYLIFLWIFFISFLPFWFQKNNAIYKNFELISLSQKTYNYNILNIIQEKELLSVGIKFAWVLWLTDSEINSFVKKLYEYEKSVDIKLPSQIPNALINKKEQKYIIYTPESVKKDELIMILHGSVGWFLFYQKFFKQFWDTHNTQIVTPVFWWWNWFESGWIELIYNTYYDLVAKWKILPHTKVTLIWVSNGGTGLSRIVATDKNNIFPKIIFISWVMESNIIESEAFRENAWNTSFYVIHWKKDINVSYDNFLRVENKYPQLKKLIFENGDHYILLNQEKNIIQEIENILNE